MNRTLYFGEGLFETIKWFGENEKLKLHYERLKTSADFLGLPCPSYEEFLAYIKTVVGEDSGLYVKFLLLSKGSSYYVDKPESYEVRVLVREPSPPPKSVELALSSFRRHSQNPVFRHKTTSYLFNVLVRREAKEKGAFDCIVLNEREELTECSASNLILLKGKRFYTPDRESGLLWGTTLEYLIRKGVDIREKSLKVKELSEADSVFITNSLMGVVPVRKFLEREFTVNESLCKELNSLLEPSG
ncbi:4-amino-4-deoxychorismate lyase [Hydrogenivirga caldilitoris]|uniref:4-amino-4-deoxychorismate lyase n=1 Tax=Hydrogenivirga caldilitoris TaxID=246264 RepID=A0A497XUZ5_9AQUI|nr:aminotransferase class IV [Hydrogenivirga caldilitoris]RLJ70972.1 4-amino-4-deoxychorismate lyase [Hydrogenivirga caldilitoris]